MRYDLDFKIKVIAHYKQEHSVGATGEKFAVNPRFMSKWVKQYKMMTVDCLYDPCRQIRTVKLGRF